ncbi:unnamed protein product [Amoebophrya sp. A25]|nr:unnamed protein product [Amoebophrya sp. A25]|eukprot:GSA25T00007893001.1
MKLLKAPAPAGAAGGNTSANSGIKTSSKPRLLRDLEEQAMNLIPLHDRIRDYERSEYPAEIKTFLASQLSRDWAESEDRRHMIKFLLQRSNDMSTNRCDLIAHQAVELLDRFVSQSEDWHPFMGFPALFVARKLHDSNPFVETDDSYECILKRFLAKHVDWTQEECERMEIDLLTRLNFRLLRDPLPREFVSWCGNVAGLSNFAQRKAQILLECLFFRPAVAWYPQRPALAVAVAYFSCGSEDCQNKVLEIAMQHHSLLQAVPEVLSLIDAFFKAAPVTTPSTSSRGRGISSSRRAVEESSNSSTPPEDSMKAQPSSWPGPSSQTSRSPSPPPASTPPSTSSGTSRQETKEDNRGDADSGFLAVFRHVSSNHPDFRGQSATLARSFWEIGNTRWNQVAASWAPSLAKRQRALGYPMPSPVRPKNEGAVRTSSCHLAGRSGSPADSFSGADTCGVVLFGKRDEAFSTTSTRASSTASISSSASTSSSWMIPSHATTAKVGDRDCTFSTDPPGCSGSGEERVGNASSSCSASSSSSCSNSCSSDEEVVAEPPAPKKSRTTSHYPMPSPSVHSHSARAPDDVLMHVVPEGSASSCPPGPGGDAFHPKAEAEESSSSCTRSCSSSSSSHQQKEEASSCSADGCSTSSNHRQQDHQDETKEHISTKSSNHEECQVQIQNEPESSQPSGRSTSELTWWSSDSYDDMIQSGCSSWSSSPDDARNGAVDEHEDALTLSSPPNLPEPGLPEFVVKKVKGVEERSHVGEYVFCDYSTGAAQHLVEEQRKVE